MTQDIKADLKPIHIIGGGMAGSEAAWQAANMGCTRYIA